jgi:hypothetical protein
MLENEIIETPNYQKRWRPFAAPPTLCARYDF